MGQATRRGDVSGDHRQLDCVSGQAGRIELDSRQKEVRAGRVRAIPPTSYRSNKLGYDADVRDIFSRIERDHRKIIGILDALEIEVDSNGDASHIFVLRRRRKLAQQLVIEESRHEAAEEIYLWPAVRETVDAGRGRAESGVRQEGKAKRMLQHLDKAASRGRDDNPRAVEDLLPSVSEALREHISYEESAVLPRLRLSLSDADAARLGLMYENAKTSGPTRPHPMTPPLPGILRTVGKAAAAMDTARDVVTRRGK